MYIQSGRFRGEEGITRDCDGGDGGAERKMVRKEKEEWSIGGYEGVGEEDREGGEEGGEMMREEEERGRR